MHKETRYIISIVSLSALFVIFYISPPFTIVQPGFAGIHTRMGHIVKCCQSSGLYWKTPFIENIIPIDMRIRKSVINAEAFSHDLQMVQLEVAINYRVIDAELIYKEIGLDYEKIVIDPFTQESVKAIIAQFSAEELTQHRNEAKEKVKEDLRKSLESVHIKLVDFNFIHADFHEDFIRSVENKQIAEQQAKQAKYETERVKELALQTQAKAEAEAYAMRIQREQITRELAFVRAVEKWDGQLPRILTGNALIDLKGYISP